jgi:hypothetical protein
VKYNQPYGITDPDAPYINGNPSTGTMGSIPPAPSIEHPQREIVNVIQYAFDNKYVDQNGAVCAAPSAGATDQLLKSLFGVMNSRLLRAPQNYYVNGATGNDANNGLGAGTPFKTIQRALDVAVTWNQNGFRITISVAAGIYDGIVLPQLNGSGGCNLVGASTATCTISGVNKSAIAQYTPSSGYDISGFALGCAGVGVPGDHMCGVQLYAGSNVIRNVKFLNCVEAHMMSVQDGTIIPEEGIEIAGSAMYHIWSEWNSHLTNASMPVQPILTISQPVTFNYFAYCSAGSLQAILYRQIIGAANVTGAKFLVSGNSVMATNGSGVNYLPGSTPGVIQTGGQYL